MIMEPEEGIRVVSDLLQRTGKVEAIRAAGNLARHTRFTNV